MARTLSILEVSQKQRYIYRDKQLRKNAQRSLEIAYVTDDLFFRRVAGEVYDTAKNLGYSGGGHTIVQFDTLEDAVRFNRLVTGKAQELFPGMEVFAATIPYDGTNPGAALQKLTQTLEKKKALRRDSFRYMGIGPEVNGTELEGNPLPPEIRAEIESLAQKAPRGKEYTMNLQEKDENFMAVVHIDGNAMGKRVQQLYDQNPDSCDALFAMLRRFSDSIKQHYSEAFLEMAQVVAANFPTRKILPLRPVVMAGDDVCFVCRGDIALECARIFMEKLAGKYNAQDGKPYTACAGVTIVHNKYPFFRAYALAEALCRKAKEYGSSLNPDGSVCAMDWHIEFGEMKEHLDEIRQEYLDEDGIHLELRPMAVSAPQGVAVPKHRQYRNFRNQIQAFRSAAVQEDRMARGKLKGLRNVLKQGRPETEFYLTNRTLMEKLQSVLSAGADGQPSLYCQDPEGTWRSILFDTIEISDHFQFLKEGNP